MAILAPPAILSAPVDPLASVALVVLVNVEIPTVDNVLLNSAGPFTNKFAPTFKLPLIPTPPVTTTAPVPVVVLSVPTRTFSCPLMLVIKFLILAVPVVAPMVISVAAPNAFTVVMLALNRFNVPVAVDSNVGLAPLIRRAKALGSAST